MIYEALRTSPLIILLRAVVHFGGGGTSYEPHKTRYILPLVISHSTWRQPSLLFPSPRLVFEDSRRPRVYLNAHRSPDIFIYRQAWQHRRRALRPLSSSFLRAPLRERREGERPFVITYCTDTRFAVCVVGLRPRNHHVSLLFPSFSCFSFSLSFPLCVIQCCASTTALHSCQYFSWPWRGMMFQVFHAITAQ